MITKKLKDNIKSISDLKEEFAIKLFDNSFAYEYVDRLEEYERELLDFSWNEFDENDRKDILTNYVLKNIDESIAKFNEFGVEFNIENIINISKEIQSASKEHKRAFKTILYYLNFAEIVNKDIIKECTDNIDSGHVNLKFRLTVPLGYYITCPSCNEKHRVDFLTPSFKLTGACSNCSHYIYSSRKLGSTPGSSFDYTVYNCNCNGCKSRRERLKKDLESIKENWVNESTTQLHGLAQALNDAKKIDISDITEKQLKNYYLINKNNLDKTTREILSMEPQNYEEVVEIIEQMVESKFYNNRDKILKSLIDTKVIYKKPIKETKTVSLNKFNAFLHNTIEYVTDDFARQLVFILFGFIKNKVFLTGCNVGNSGNIQYAIEGVADLCDSPTYEYALNPYFLRENIKKEHLKTSKHNILKSNAELCTLNDLILRYPDYLILPNYPLSQMIEINNFKDFFEKSELKYLKYCVYDFVIIDKDGYVAKVVECQKGKHHNDKEWIKKDYLKRKILELSKIDFEEVF